MSGSWLNNQQWTSGTQGSGTPPMSHPGWGQQGGGWQGMQQGPPANSYPTNQQFQQGHQGQFPYQNQGGSVPFQGQQPPPGQGQFQRAPQGFAPRQQFSGQYPGGGGGGGGPMPVGNFGYQNSPPQHRQRPQMSPQQLRQQQQQALEQQLKEEQRLREVAVQRRKMERMDLSKASKGNLDDLIGMAAPKSSGSPSRSRSKKPPAKQHSESRNETAGANEVSRGKDTSSSTSESGKARSWTTDSTSLEGVFAQHSQLGQPAQVSSSADSSFGDFQSGPSGGSEYGEQGNVGRTFGEMPYSEGGGGGVQAYGNMPAQRPTYGGMRNNQPQINQRNILSRKAPLGPVSFTTSNQRPVASTSESGWTKKGYISSDTTQTQSHGGFSGGGGGGDGPNPPPSGSRFPDQPLSPPKFAGLDSSKFPVVYMDVYRRCVTPGGTSISTELLFPLLLSSHLQRSVLRDLWTLANRGVPGKLNQTELFVLLGLIALVQSGNSSPTLEDLKRAPQPPVPVLAALSTAPSAPPLQQLNTQNQFPSSQPSSQSFRPPVTSSPDDFGDFQQGSTATASTHVSTATMSSHSKLLVPSSASSQTTTATTELSSMFPIPEYQPPPGDKYGAFEALVQAKEQEDKRTSSGSSRPEDGTSGTAAGRDKYADLVGLASSTPPSAAGSSGVLIPTPAQSSLAPSQSESSSLLQPLKSSSSDEKKPDKDEFGSFLSGPSQLQSSSIAISTTGGSLLLSSGLPSATTTKMNDETKDDFGSFASGPPASSAVQVGTKDSSWANFTQFVSQPPSVPQSSTILFPSSSQPPSIPPLDQPVTSTTSSTNLSLGHEFGVVTTTAPSTAPSSSSLDSLSFFSSGNKSTNISTSAASLLGDLTLDPPKSSPKTSKKVTSRAASGLELLEEEFSNRILSKQDEAPPSLALSPTLVPEHSGSGSATPLEEKFGEFEGYSAAKSDGLECVTGSATSFTKTPPEPGKVWKSCLTKCQEVLSQCAAVLGGSRSEEEGVTLLQEVATSEEGQNKLRGIVEVYKLARRIHACVKDNDCGDNEFNELIAGTKMEWEKLGNILPNKVMDQLFEESISSASCSQGDQHLQSGMEDKDFLSDAISRCSLCLMGKDISISSSSSLSSSPENYSLALLFHNGKTYHATCCNFWANVVQEPLPDLCD